MKPGEFFERIGMETFYVIEVETKSGNIEKEAELYYSAEGVLIKATSGYDSDYDYEDYLPSAVLTQVNAAYPSWKIDDAEFMETPSGNWFVIELEKGESEVKIRITANGVIL